MRKQLSESRMPVTPAAMTTPVARSTIQATSPSINAVSAVKEGMSYTDMYARIVDAERELEEARQENEKLRGILHRVQDDMEKKAPEIVNLRDSYNRLIVAHEKRSSEYEALVRSERVATAQLQRTTQQRDNLTKELQAAKQEVSDLGSQVQNLLRQQVKGQLHSALNMSSPMSAGRLSIASAAQGHGEGRSSDSISTAKDVISANLVNVSDISDMQRKNQQLLRVVRWLTDEREREASDEISLNNAKIIALEKAKNEIGQLKEERARQSKLVQAIVNQRDTQGATCPES